MKHLVMKSTAVLGMALAMSLTYEPAEARRGGSFGSRGARTFQAPPPTRTAPQQTAPVQRTMTQPPQKASPQASAPAAGAPAQAPRRGGFLGGMGGGILGGLLAGGLIGMLLGNGFGGFGAGLANTLMQVALVAGGLWLAMLLFRRLRRPALAPAGFSREAASGPGPTPFQGLGGAPSGAAEAPNPRSTYIPPTPAMEDIGLLQSDRDRFERLLFEVQDAFGREDYAALRALTTPEIMSYLSEELSQNATQGRRNEVSQTRLLQADVAEAWREGDADYATAAMRYESIDLMRDRQSGAVVDGDPDRPTEATELWTFVRHGGGDWKLSAIQQA